ncbi:P-loop NTPase fold protein [Pectobacterium sp. CHL-2024]|uniref:P-loop NTPase fold protein n=1 Tax=Pectobacterium TaxID=122277 RepID=UPI0004E7A8A4|nr:P-loop NTPase fold protein [Pectobacterium brasiliense]KFF63443.1 hypothetical protein IV99_18805 [Pectobacterium brasiliense]
MQKINSEIRFSDRDEYSRKSVAEKLIALLSSNGISISPVMIDGGWGTGKTEFCYKLINLLKEDHPDFNAIYIDAFSEDHANAPTMILLAAIFKILPEQEQSKLIKKAIPVLRFGLKTALKAGANFVLRQNGENIADEFQHAIKETSETAINESVEKILKEHIESEKNINLLKKALEKTSHEKPIIIFIDELDRCRPDFSISILENIKHIFNIKNVSFVLIANLKQLESTINAMYGHSFNAKKYLDKFINFNYKLPSHTDQGKHFTSISSLHWDNILSQDNQLRVIKDNINISAPILIEKSELSLREVETLFRYFKIYQELSNDQQRITTGKGIGYTTCRLIGIFLYCFRPELSNEISIKKDLEKLDMNELGSALGIIKLDRKHKSINNNINIVFYNMLNDYDLFSDKYPRPDDKEIIIWGKLSDEIFSYNYNGNAIYIIQDTIHILQLK